MKKSDFHFDLPPELVAQAPLAERSASRMLVLPTSPVHWSDRRVRDLPEFLRAGDLLVFNDTRVIPARQFIAVFCGEHLSGICPGALSGTHSCAACQ